MRPVFCGNIDYETRQSELERLFSKYGRVDRVDIKTGFAFIYFEDERDAEDAIRALDNRPFGYDRRRISVEWAKGERGHGRDGSRSMANQRPTRTLFVINFDPVQTRPRDIERHFERYGKVLNVRVRRNFAFVRFETQEAATEALECTHMRPVQASIMAHGFVYWKQPRCKQGEGCVQRTLRDLASKILDRVVSVEYALRDDDERDEGYGNTVKGGSYGKHGGSPYGYRRSPSPAYGRARPSPDYGRRGSPDYGRPRSPIYDRYNGPSYGRLGSPGYDRYRSRSPVRR